MVNTDTQDVPHSVEMADAQTLLEADTRAPCISIYLETSRLPTEGEKNRIAFKDAIKSARDALVSSGYEEARINDLLAPLWELESDSRFWQYQSEGLAVFRSPERCWIRKLAHSVGSRTVVADSFHLRPLLRVTQSMRRYRLLCISMERVALYEGNGPVLVDVPLHENVPSNMADALGDPDHVTRDRRSQYDYTEHDQRQDQMRRYLRRVDEAIWEHHCRKERLPLMVAGLSEHQSYFREVTHNPDLVETGLVRDPFHNMDLRELGQRAWESFTPEQTARLEALRERFGNAKAHGYASKNIREIGREAVFAQIDTLIVAEEATVGGELDRETGEVEVRDINDPDVDDLLDDIAELTLGRNGRVLVLPKEEMPNDEPAVAILRYKVST